jgi:hypothetical protein
MNTLIVIILVIAIGLYWAYTGFLVAASAKRILGAGVKLPLGFKATAYVWFVRGVIGDFIGNVYLGLTEFHELPHWTHGELMFSSRVQRHVDGPVGWRRNRAIEWAYVLNAAIPDHIHRLPS